MTDQLVKDNERIDDLQNGYYVIQDPDKFCFGMDAVLLSGFAKVKKGETALDLGTGTGIIPILLKTKTNGKHFTGLEIQKECADMAGRSVRYIIWRTMLRSYRVILRRLLIFLGQLLLM